MTLISLDLSSDTGSNVSNHPNIRARSLTIFNNYVPLNYNRFFEICLDMNRSILALFKYQNQAIVRNYCSKVVKDKWHLFSGVLVERLPVISKNFDALEQKYQDTLNQIEFENSLLSDFEIRHDKEQKKAALLKTGKLEDSDIDIMKQTAQDLKDAYKEELSKFVQASRTTEADQKNDTKSLKRKLDETLILLVEQKLGTKNFMLLPQGKREDGETMRQTAERVLMEKCGSDLSFKIYGNAPCGFYKYKYPKSNRDEAIGAKVFFYRAVLKPESKNITDKKVKYEWLMKDELKGKVNESYFHCVSQITL